ncbi:MAG: HK97 family phage prohead protease [Burkholderiaceae bacterium]|nr:HK97 family phage prohead protease [Burkholderiaceae bacterium]
MLSMDHVAGRFAVKAIEDSGTFAGYGSVYGVLDAGDDVIAPGAFSESVQKAQQSGLMPALLWQHKASEPIGAYTLMREDDHGLYVEGRLALRTQRGLEAYELMRMHAVSGLSVGFQTKDDAFDAKTGVRTIRKGDLWEVSLVTFPMNNYARVHAVKSMHAIGDLAGAERYLREHLGLSRTQAKGFVARIFGLARREVDASPPQQGPKPEQTTASTQGCTNNHDDPNHDRHQSDATDARSLSRAGSTWGAPDEIAPSNEESSSDKPASDTKTLDWTPIALALKARLSLLQAH